MKWTRLYAERRSYARMVIESSLPFNHLLELMSVNLPTLAKDEKGLHAAACEFSKLFEYRVQYLCTHSPDVLLHTAPINGSQLKHHRH